MSNIRSFLVFFLLGFHPVVGQFVISEDRRIEELNLQGALPEKLLSTRSAGFYDYKLTTKELGEVQSAFHRFHLSMRSGRYRLVSVLPLREVPVHSKGGLHSKNRMKLLRLLVPTAPTRAI